MTREVLTREIARRLKEIRELYYKEYPEGNYLTLYFRKDAVSFNNEHWKDGKDAGFPIDYYENKEFIMTNKTYEDKK